MPPNYSILDHIDLKLRNAGWIVQEMKQFNPGVSLGVAVHGYPTDAGPADYVLFVNRLPYGVIEIIKDEMGQFLTISDCHKARFANGVLTWTQEGYVLPFVYQSTGVCTQFTDNRDPFLRSRLVFSFHRPQSMHEWIEQRTMLRCRLRGISSLRANGLNDFQFNVLQTLEESFENTGSKALIRTASVPEKRFTEFIAAYHLLKYAGVRKILFLVDSINLEQIIEHEIQECYPNGDHRKFSELFRIQRLNAGSLNQENRIYISSFESIYSLLRDEVINRKGKHSSLQGADCLQQAKGIVYNPMIPIEMFDLVIIDDSQSAASNSYKQILEYFDAYFLGFTTATNGSAGSFFLNDVVPVTARKGLPAM